MVSTLGGCARRRLPTEGLHYRADAPSAPAFSATDYVGHRVTLRRLIQRGPLVLVFLRDLACPYGRHHLRRLRDHYDKLGAAGATVAVVVHAAAARVARRWARERLPFIGIPDPDGTLAKVYRQPWRFLQLGRMPALFIIDGRGRLVVSQRGRDMADIPPLRAVLDALRRAAPRSVAPYPISARSLLSATEGGTTE